MEKSRVIASPSAQTSVAVENLRLALFSSGLGAINRGFEISTARTFRQLQESAELDVRLFSGADFPESTQVPCINRNTWLKFPLQYFPFLKREMKWRIAYALEQTSFCFGLLNESTKPWQPQVVWTKEVPLAHVLYEFRRISGNPYKIIFANGGGFRPSTYQQFDFVQHLHPEAYEEALSFGIPAEKMTVLPNLIPEFQTHKSKEDLRREYGFNSTDWIVICVAAWNRHHKRIDYLINEVADAGLPDCKLIICGQPEPDAASLQQLAQERLGDRVLFLTVAEERVAELLRLSDLFVLCSLYEGLGAVMAEAALAGLPVLSHPHGGSRYILQDERWFVDMTESGTLAQRLKELRMKPLAPALLSELKESVEARFDRRKIGAEFAAMVKKVHQSGDTESGLAGSSIA